MQDMRTAVPAANSPANLGMRDVIGNKLDDQNGDSVAARVHTIDEHIHSPSKVYPTLAAGVAITAGLAWVLGNFVQIVPAAAIGNDFDIHWLSIEDLDTNDVYEIVLYYGASDTEAGRVRVTKNAVQDGTMNIPMQTPIIPAGSRIRAKCASAAGGSIATISIFYHEYP